MYYVVLYQLRSVPHPKFDHKFQCLTQPSMIVLLHPEADRWPVLSCLSPVSGSFFKSLNKNCDQQVDID